MTQWALLVDHELCFDCKACEVACKQENNLPVGSRWISVVAVGPRKVGDNLRLDFVPVVCLHCSQPPCADACPTRAIRRREDGIVLIDPALCTGCKACITACPFGAIGINPKTELAEKCTLCLDRIQQGLRPACVQHCQAGAIFFGDITEISGAIKKERAQRRKQY